MVERMPSAATSRSASTVLPSAKCATTDGPAGLAEASDRAPTMVMRRWERVAQQPVDAFPGGQHLRAFAGTHEAAPGVEDRGPGWQRRTPPARCPGGGCDRSAPAARQCRHRGPTARFRRAHRHRRPSRRPQLERRQEAAHRAADHQGPPFPCCVHAPDPVVFNQPEVVIYRTKPGGMPWL